MKGLLEKIEAIWMAVAFAEAGEWETAKEWIESSDKRKDQETLRSKRTYLRA